MSQTEDARQLEDQEPSPEVQEFRQWVDSMPQPNAEATIELVLDPESGVLHNDWGLVVMPFDEGDAVGRRGLDEGIAVIFRVKFAHDGPMQGIPARVEVAMPHSSAAALGLSLLTEVMRVHPQRVGSLPPLYHDLEHLADDLRAYRAAHGLQPHPRKEWGDLQKAT